MCKKKAKFGGTFGSIRTLYRSSIRCRRNLSVASALALLVAAVVVLLRALILREPRKNLSDNSRDGE